MEIEIEVEAIASHRNGIGGEPFHVVLFHDDKMPMLGIVFGKEGHVAVLHRGKLAEGDVAFGSNSWRGDEYEAELREAIAVFEEEQRKRWES